jgi:hypothetical protein
MIRAEQAMIMGFWSSQRPLSHDHQRKVGAMSATEPACVAARGKAGR